MVTLFERVGGAFDRVRTASAQRTRSTRGESPLLFWLTIVGAVLLPLGLLVIGLGWYGAAHTPYSYEQTPYLISGGLLGVGIVLTGGFIYFGTWLARLLVENRA